MIKKENINKENINEATYEITNEAIEDVGTLNMENDEVLENEMKDEVFQPVDPISKRETFQLMKGAMMAAYAVAAVIILVFLLFILFCVYIWF